VEVIGTGDSGCMEIGKMSQSVFSRTRQSGLTDILELQLGGLFGLAGFLGTLNLRSGE
jgi:hypothetical protein